MGRHYTEGLLFIPIQRIASRRALVQRILTFIDGPLHILNWGITTSGTNYRNLSLQAALERVCQSDEPGSFFIDLGGFATEIKLQHPQQDYYSLILEVDKYAFLEIEGDPARVEIFSAAWVRFCEAMQASAAVFSRELGYDRPQHIEKRLHALQQQNMAAFVTHVDWRTYLEPALGQLWREQVPEPQHHSIHVVEVSSGALVIHAEPGYNPELGNDDTVLHLRFLLEYLKTHQELPGSDRLLTYLQKQDDDPLRRYLELRETVNLSSTSPEQRAEYSTLDRTLHDLVMDVRASLACASRLTDVVSLYQPMKMLDASGETREIEVPIIRERGRVWITATLLYPYELRELTYEKVHLALGRVKSEREKLRERVRRLLETAQQHPIEGKPPRLLVFFWRGVTDEMCAELNSLNVDVEVADQLPLLE